MSKPQNPKSGANVLTPAITLSPRFNAVDADVIFKSSDNVLFRVHRKNLETSTCGFPPAEFVLTDKKPVGLPETSDVLDLLFQFIYPQRQPNLLDVDFSLLARVAEAAEKYEVFTAMNICHTRMSEQIPEHSVEILNYSIRHEYWDLADRAAPSTIKVPHNIIGKLIDPKITPTWLEYNELWNNFIDQSGAYYYRGHWVSTGDYCPELKKAIQTLAFDEPVKKRIMRALYSLGGGVRSCSDYCVGSYVTELQKGLDKITKFSFLFRGITPKPAYDGWPN